MLKILYQWYNVFGMYMALNVGDLGIWKRSMVWGLGYLQKVQLLCGSSSWYLNFQNFLLIVFEFEFF